MESDLDLSLEAFDFALLDDNALRSRCNTWPRPNSSEENEENNNSSCNHNTICNNNKSNLNDDCSSNAKTEAEEAEEEKVRDDEKSEFALESMKTLPITESMKEVPIVVKKECEKISNETTKETTSNFESSVAKCSVVPFSPPSKSVCSRRNPWGNVSYADLITQAIQSSPDQRLTLAQIYEWISKNVPYFHGKGDSVSSSGWKNSIRHNLSLHNRFVRVQNEGSGKSSWWMVNADAPPTKPQTSKVPRKRANTFDNSKFEHRGRKGSRAGALRLKNKTPTSATASPQMRRSVSNNSVFNAAVATANALTAANSPLNPNDSGLKTFNLNRVTTQTVNSPLVVGSLHQPQSPDLLSSSFRPRTSSSPGGRLSPCRDRTSSTTSTTSTNFLSTEELMRKFEDIKTEALDEGMTSADVDLANLRPFDPKLDPEATEELMNELIKVAAEADLSPDNHDPILNGNNFDVDMDEDNNNGDNEMDAVLHKIKILEPRVSSIMATPTTPSPSSSSSLSSQHASSSSSLSSPFLYHSRVNEYSGGLVTMQPAKDLNIAYPMEMSLQPKLSSLFMHRGSRPVALFRQQPHPFQQMSNVNNCNNNVAIDGMADMGSLVPPSSASSGLGHETATHLSTVSEDHEEEMNPLFEQLAAQDFDLDLNPSVTVNPLSVGGFTAHQSLLFRTTDSLCSARSPSNNSGVNTSKPNRALSMGLF